jgi:hypothetical protein
MDLFWETRNLTQAREDHLTCFVAAALEVDAAFRSAYESRVLAPLAASGAVPRIAKVRTQVTFVAEHCRPDMMLDLAGGRAIACEHKLDAPETLQAAEDGETLQQLERYLELPCVDAVVYVRPSLKPPADLVLQHPRYLRPPDAPHFLWRDLYEPLEKGRHDVTAWLRRGFERLGFTPPVPHVGELWPDDSEDVKRNQSNFDKLWNATRSHLSASYKVSAGRRCELYLEPHQSRLIRRAYVSPLAQGGSLLRVRLEPCENVLPELRRRLEAAVPVLRVPPEVSEGRLANGHSYIDLLAPLRLVLGTDTDAKEHESKLYGQVVPVLEAVLLDA